jgi:hypothetical protein
MATFSSETGVLANTTLIIELVKTLAAKGILTDEDWQKTLQGALTQLTGHSEGAAAIDFIAEIAKLERA